MSRVDYFQIEQAIQLQLQTALGAGVEILLEEGVSATAGDCVIIYLNRRDAPDGMQSISAGSRTRFLLQLSIWCFHTGVKVVDVMKARNTLMGRVEIALMQDRSFGLTDAVIQSSWITGGEFQTIQRQTGFTIGGEIALVADVIAVNQ